MKLVGNISDVVCTQSQLAKALSLSQARVNQLIDEGVVIRDESSKNGAVMMLDSLRNYYLSKNATGDNVNFWKEKGLHEKAKRELAEVKLSKTRGELYEATTVEAVMSELLTNFRSKLLGLPAKFAAQLEGKARADIYKTLTTAVEESLSDLAAGLESANFEVGQDAQEDAGEGSQADT